MVCDGCTIISNLRRRCIRYCREFFVTVSFSSGIILDTAPLYSCRAVAAGRALLFSADGDERSRRRDTADRRRKNTGTWTRPGDGWLTTSAIFFVEAHEFRERIRH